MPSATAAAPAAPFGDSPLSGSQWEDSLCLCHCEIPNVVLYPNCAAVGVIGKGSYRVMVLPSIQGAELNVLLEILMQSATQFSREVKG